jgi:hypothetical protein
MQVRFNYCFLSLGNSKARRACALRYVHGWTPKAHIKGAPNEPDQTISPIDNSPESMRSCLFHIKKVEQIRSIARRARCLFVCPEPIVDKCKERF